MLPDFSNKRELTCGDCNRPILFSRVSDNPSKITLIGCRCKREIYDIPDGTLVSTDGELFFHYA
jgi:hypothetical protein